MRQLAGPRHSRRYVAAALAAVTALAVLVAALMASHVETAVAPVASSSRHPPSRFVLRGYGLPRIGRIGAERPRFSGPLALIVSRPGDSGPGPGGGATATGGTGVGGLDGGADQTGTDQGDGGVWPDSSSPVRNAPSNATTGPAIPPVFSLPGWTITKVGLTEGARLRYYLVARPTTVSASRLPVLLVLPGRNMTPSTIARASGFLPLVGQAVVVFPAGFANSWNAGYCCGVAHLAGVNDVGFLKRVIQSVLASQPGTSARDVYIAGFSNGGRMALDMACADPGAFAGVAAVEAVAVSSCARTSPVPLLDIASTADPLLTISADARPKHIAGHVEITVDALIAHWRTVEGCGVRTVRTRYPVMTYTVWPHCYAGARVAMAVYDGGRHVWPHGGPGTPAAQTVIWDFFHGVDSPAPPPSANPT